MSRIVITTWGSLGDLHPYLAIGLRLRERGHEVVIATAAGYRQRVEAQGLGFHPVRPDVRWLSDPESVKRYSHPRWGLLRVGRELLMPAIRQSYEDTLAAAQGADLLVSMLATYATSLVAEKLQIPWASALHIPMGFFSAFDPPVLEISPRLSRKLHALGPHFWRPVFAYGKRATRVLAQPWYQLRAELGLPPTTIRNPLVDNHSPSLVLALFSRLLADKQKDWPPQAMVTGFPFYDADCETALSPDLSRFLDRGTAPIVFTLGSAVSGNAGTFYEHSAECAKRLKRRAVLVTGNDVPNELLTLSKDIIAVDYAPFTQLFPKTAAVVHHGGIGTTGLAMRAGCPMLIVPTAWDQPDNANRAVRLGIARQLDRRQYTPSNAAAELRRLLDDPGYAIRASEVRKRVELEDGLGNACRALESLLPGGP